MSRCSARPSGRRRWAFPMPLGSARWPTRIDRARRDFGIEARIIGICIRHLGPDRALALAQQHGGRAASLCRGARHGRRRGQVHAGRLRAGLSAGAREGPGLHRPCRRGRGTGKRVGRHPRPAGDPHRPWRALDRGPGAGRGAGAARHRAGGLPGQQRGARPVSQPRRPSAAALDRGGVRVTLGSDDPPFFHTTLGTEYDEAGLGEQVLRTITRTAIEASFADEATKAKLLKGDAVMIARRILALGAVALVLGAGAASAQEPTPSDMLLATLWTQRSVEYKGNALTVYALAQDPPRPGAGRQELDGGAGRAEGRLREPAAGGRARRRRDGARQLALRGLDAEEQPDLQHQDLERVLRGPDLARRPGRRRVHQATPTPRA